MCDLEAGVVFTNWVSNVGKFQQLTPRVFNVGGIELR